MWHIYVYRFLLCQAKITFLVSCWKLYYIFQVKCLAIYSFKKLKSSAESSWSLMKEYDEVILNYFFWPKCFCWDLWKILGKINTAQKIIFYNTRLIHQVWKTKEMEELDVYAAWIQFILEKNSFFFFLTVVILSAILA